MPGGQAQLAPLAGRTVRRNGILVSLGETPITADTVRRIDDEDDELALLPADRTRSAPRVDA